MVNRPQAPSARPKVKTSRWAPSSLTKSDRLTVALVHRTWTSRRGDGDPTARVRTEAPPGVEVRREPPADVVEPGGLSPRATRELARLLVQAAELAEAPGAPPPNDDKPERRSTP